jgi:hypothetical protein
MIEHMKHFSNDINERYPDVLAKYDKKINELIRVVNILEDGFRCYRMEHMTPAKKAKLAKIQKLEKELKQLKLEI